MKNWVFMLIVSAIYSCASGGQRYSVCCSNAQLYYNSFLYITKDLGTKDVYVFDSLVYIDKNFFPKSLQISNETYLQSQWRLLSEDEKHQSDPAVFSKELKKFIKTKKAKYILFFSKKEDNILFAEVLGMKNKQNLTFDYYKRFNSGKRYLFMLGAKGEILGVHVTQVQYN
ncbi:MAG: hypothetical protein ACOYPR_21675 [Saprospiraceae bacterium]